MFNCLFVIFQTIVGVLPLEVVGRSACLMLPLHGEAGDPGMPARQDV